MTPGRQALIEAMRHEQARIYGQLCLEHRTVDERRARRDREDLEAALASTSVVDMDDARQRRKRSA